MEMTVEREVSEMASDPSEVRLVVEAEGERLPLRSVLLEAGWGCEICGREDGRAWILGEDDELGPVPICDDDLAMSVTVVEVVAGEVPVDFAVADDAWWFGGER